MQAGIYQFRLTVTDDGGLSAKDTVQVLIEAAAGNHAPIACAGVMQVVTFPTNTAILNGTCSTDPDNNIVAYHWTKIAGPSSFTIADADAIKTVATDLEKGIYQFELKVTDVEGLSSKDTLQITVNDATPDICNNNNRPTINVRLVEVGTLSRARVGMSVVSAGNKIFFAGGLGVSSRGHSSRVDIYDLNTQAWTTAELCIGRSDMATAVNGNKVFFAGGEIGDGTIPVDSVDIYNLSTNTWEVAHLSRPGNSIAAASVGNKVLFAGGDAAFSGPSRSSIVDIYDVTSGTCSRASLSGKKRDGHAAVAINNKIYIGGGGSPEDNYAAAGTIDIYDLASDSWSTTSLLQPRSGMAALAVANKIYWAGGEDKCSVEINDITTGNTSLQYLHKPELWFINVGQNAVVKDNKIIFYGSGDRNDSFDIYDIASDSWSIAVKPLGILHASIISVNNTVYLAGGSINTTFVNKVYKLEF